MLVHTRGAHAGAGRAALGKDVTNADLILCTHKHASHMDAGSLPAILQSVSKYSGRVAQEYRGARLYDRRRRTSA